MRSRIITPPASEPITLDEAKEFLRVTHAHEDATITRQIRAARQACEKVARMCFISQTWETELLIPKARIEPLLMPSSVSDPDGVLQGARLIRRPATSVVSVTVQKAAQSNSAVVVPSSEYAFNPNNNRVEWANPMTFIQTYLNPNDRMRVQYVVGNSVDNFKAQYPTIEEAIFLTVSNLYENRGLSAQTVPPAAIDLLAPFWSSPTYDTNPNPIPTEHEIWSQGRWFDQPA